MESFALLSPWQLDSVIVTQPISVVMMGASGAVGTSVVGHLLKSGNVGRLTLLGRRPAAAGTDTVVHQHVVDVFEAKSYAHFLPGHQTAICTLGVGQPSKVSLEEFIKLDKLAVLDFAAACKAAGVVHFQLLSSVGSNPDSRLPYLRAKGELQDGLEALAFDRLSVFHPSMILTPTNRYGLSQAVLLKLWPVLSVGLIGSLRKYRGVKIGDLGRAIARNAATPGAGYEHLFWDDIMGLSNG
jgi:uncharacterized protein YbjT (DUF2867 family)